MAKTKNRENLSIELKLDESERFRSILDSATARNPLTRRTHVIRELLYLSDYGVTTPEERAYFRGIEPADEILALSMQQIITDLYGGISPEDAEKFRYLAKQIGTERADELAAFDAAEDKKPKRKRA